MTADEGRSPLEGHRVVELAGIGPGPFACTILADLGCEVIRIDRLAGRCNALPDEIVNLGVRGRTTIAMDLKSSEGQEVARSLIDSADILLEGFRPGVAERLGIGPERFENSNPGLVYVRLTGWGQEGPYAGMAGHDINYIGLSGALHAIGRDGQVPVPPLNLVGDFGGGGMLLAFGMVCGLLEASQSGRGQVIDSAMTDGSAILTTFIHGLKAMGAWSTDRSANLLDTGAPFYDAYETADGRYITIGSIEPQFYSQLLAKLGWDDLDLDAQHSKATWPDLRSRLTSTFKSRTRDEWVALLEGSDVCFSPVLSMDEAPRHPHNIARQTFVEVAGITQPAPAPRFSRTPGEATPPPAPGRDTDEVLAEAGLQVREISSLRESGAIR